jgi:hypothetical protein
VTEQKLRESQASTNSGGRFNKELQLPGSSGRKKSGRFLKKETQHISLKNCFTT